MNRMAQDWAEIAVKQTKLLATPGKRPYAENIYRVSGGSPIADDEVAELAFKSWNKSASYYNYEHPKPTAYSQMVIWCDFKSCLLK